MNSNKDIEFLLIVQLYVTKFLIDLIAQIDLRNSQITMTKIVSRKDSKELKQTIIYGHADFFRLLASCLLKSIFAFTHLRIVKEPQMRE